MSQTWLSEFLSLNMIWLISKGYLQIILITWESMKCRFLRVIISVTQLRDKAAMFVDKTKFIFAKFVWKKKVFPQRRETLLFLFTSMAPAWRKQSSVTNGHSWRDITPTLFRLKKEGWIFYGVLWWKHLGVIITAKHLASIVQRLDSAIHRINLWISGYCN